MNYQSALALTVVYMAMISVFVIAVQTPTDML